MLRAHRMLSLSAAAFRGDHNQARSGRFLPCTGRGLRVPAPLGGIIRATRDSAAGAARGDQGDGGDSATAVPSQSVEKVVPEATGAGDGPNPASGPGIMPGSNSPDGASRGGVTASAAVSTTQTGMSSARDGNLRLGRQSAALASVEISVTAGRDQQQSNAGYAMGGREASPEDAGVTARRDGTQPPSAWAWAGLQNQAPGVRLLPAVPASGGAL